jgi:hypothetical protein
MVKRGSRKSVGIFNRVLSPLDHAVSLTRNVGKSAFLRSGRILNNGLGFIQNTTKSVSKHLNGAVSSITRSRKNRKNRTNRKSRKNRK